MQTQQICLSCNKKVPKKNFARHIQQHNNTHKKKCTDCNVFICTSVWKKHIRSRKHQVNKTSSGNVPTESLLHDILTISDGPLLQLSSAYRTEVTRAGGLTSLEPSRGAQSWMSLGLRPPILFPADECWSEKPPSLDVYLIDLLDQFSKKTTKVYRRGSTYRPFETPPIHIVVQQLKEPDIISPLYAINMVAESSKIRIPERLYGQNQVYKENDIITTTNITPKFSASDLHVDHGRHGVTLLYGGCVKLWALYPLSSHNFQQISKAYQSNNVFVDLQGKLEGGEFCIQTEEQAIYLPPGCIHGTITLQGGLTPGIEFTTPECLDATVLMWDLNSTVLEVSKDDCLPFLEAISISLRSSLASRREKAIAVLCKKYKKVARLKPTIWTKFNKVLPVSCTNCGHSWRRH
ncbi:hypothetical protein HD806DRAFT_499740 [Xylariaceae sp. AK1471]|nr:hypothetical protein HD806DRAFT_499740 [Xylariaceae sp. AK1471]